MFWIFFLFLPQLRPRCLFSPYIVSQKCLLQLKFNVVIFFATLFFRHVRHRTCTLLVGFKGCKHFWFFFFFSSLSFLSFLVRIFYFFSCTFAFSFDSSGRKQMYNESTNGHETIWLDWSSLWFVQQNIWQKKIDWLHTQPPKTNMLSTRCQQEERDHSSRH